jgi:hypothetical protein
MYDEPTSTLVGMFVFHTSKPSADESLEMKSVQVLPKPAGQAP